ncbi:MAG: GspE/PulE family protein [Patescibacteria group bacterium]
MSKELKSKIEGEIEQNSGEISLISLVDNLIEYANNLRASDIHIDPSAKGVRIRIRVDGVLQDVFNFPKEIKSEVVSRIKVLANLRTDEHQTAQDGRFSINFDGQAPIDIRVSVAPTYYGENAVLRLLSDKEEEYSLDKLGLSPSDRDKVLKAAKKSHGMILATGPTGSGKTTTLYMILKLLNNKEVSIITVEDPIEYAIEGIEQIQVNSRVGLNFANGLRSILRQDPDIIMVGEIRDVETAALAVNTALTGHLLLSTLHTNDSATTLPRLLDMKVEPYLVASTVNLAIAQRLVRKICSKCKARRKLTDGEKKSLEDFFQNSVLGSGLNLEFYYGEGCEKCANTGFQGRVGIFEVMLIDNMVREAFLRKASANEIKLIASGNGMSTMVEDGIRKAGNSITTLEEVLRVINE